MSRRPLRVCHAVATTEGGFWMAEQLRELRDRHGCEVYAVVSGHEGPLVDRLRAEGIPHHASHFGLLGGSSLLGALRATLDLARFFREQRFDVVQSHVFLTALTVRPAAWLADVPVRLAMIAGPFHLEAAASRWVERMTWWMETALVPSCEKSRVLCRGLGIPEARLRLVYYGPDESRFLPQAAPADVRAEFGWSEETPVVALVAFFYARLGRGPWIPESLHGRLAKGHDDFVDAAALLAPRFPEVRFLLVGGGFGGASSLDEVKERVRAHGLQDRVAFAGHRADVPALLAAVDVAVQASLCENLGGTFEALLCARPVVATRVGGMVDSVRDGETGVLVEPRNPADLARGIAELLQDPVRARSLGQAGRRLMLERFTLRRTAEDLFGVYEAARAEAGAGHRRLVPAARALLGLPWTAYVGARIALWGRRVSWPKRPPPAGGPVRAPHAVPPAAALAAPFLDFAGGWLHFCAVWLRHGFVSAYSALPEAFRGRVRRLRGAGRAAATRNP